MVEPLRTVLHYDAGLTELAPVLIAAIETLGHQGLEHLAGPRIEPEDFTEF